MTEGFLRNDLNQNRGRPDLALAHDSTADPDTPIAQAAARLLTQDLQPLISAYRGTPLCHKQTLTEFHQRHRWQSVLRWHLAGHIWPAQLLEIQPGNISWAATTDLTILSTLWSRRIRASKSKLHCASTKQGSAMALGVPLLQWFLTQRASG